MTPEKDVINHAKISAFAKAHPKLLVYNEDVLFDTVKRFYRMVMISNRNQPLKAYFFVVRDLQKSSNCDVCTEDIFILACAYLRVKVYKDLAIYYLKGKKTKAERSNKRRVSVNTLELVEMKRLISALSMPEEGRGQAARDRTIHGVDYLNNQLRLYMVVMPKLVNMLHKEKSKAQVMNELKLTGTEYEHVAAWARAEGLITFRNRKKDPDNSYALKKASHAWVKELAKQRGFTPQKMLNIIVDDFQKIVLHREKSRK